MLAEAAEQTTVYRTQQFTVMNGILASLPDSCLGNLVCVAAALYIHDTPDLQKQNLFLFTVFLQMCVCIIWSLRSLCTTCILITNETPTCCVREC